MIGITQSWSFLKSMEYITAFNTYTSLIITITPIWHGFMDIGGHMPDMEISG